MANWTEPDPKRLEDWLAEEERPQIIKDLARRFPPWKLYRLDPPGQRVCVYSYEEAGTMTVAVLAAYNLVDFERLVFGISPEDLEECDLPEEGEPLGARYTTDEEIQACIERDREAIGHEKARTMGH